MATKQSVLARLVKLRDRIASHETKVGMLYDERADVCLEGRSLPLPQRIKVRELADAAGVSVEAIHKAVARARARRDDNHLTRGAE